MGKRGWRGRGGGRWGSQRKDELEERLIEGGDIQLSERATWVAQEERLGRCHATLEARYLISPSRGLFGRGGMAQLALGVAQGREPYPNAGLNRSGRSTLPLVATEGEGGLNRHKLLESLQARFGATLSRSLRLGAVVDATCSFWDEGLLIERPSQEVALERVELTRWSELKEVRMSTRSAKQQPSAARKAYLLISEQSYSDEGKLLASERFLELLKPYAIAHRVKVIDCGSDPFIGGVSLSERWGSPTRQERA